MVEAVACGLLDEPHWVVLKQELPVGVRSHNTELAKDLASWLSTVACCLSGSVDEPWACSGSLFVVSARLVAARYGVGAWLSISRR